MVDNEKLLQKLIDFTSEKHPTEYGEMLRESIVSIPVEKRVSPMLAEEIKKARIKENLYWIEWLREVEVACPDREEYESRIEEIEKE